MLRRFIIYLFKTFIFRSRIFAGTRSKVPGPVGVLLSGRRNRGRKGGKIGRTLVRAQKARQVISRLSARSRAW